MSAVTRNENANALACYRQAHTQLAVGSSDAGRTVAVTRRLQVRAAPSVLTESHSVSTQLRVADSRHASDEVVVAGTLVV